MTALWLTLSGIFFLFYFLSSSRESVRLVTVIGMAVLALIFTGATLFLIKVGFDNNWSSDGPGILMVMIGVFIGGVISYFFWSGVLSFVSDDSQPGDTEVRERVSAELVQVLTRVSPIPVRFFVRRNMLYAAVILLGLAIVSAAL